MREQRAGVLLRRQLARGLDEHEAGRREQRQHHHQRHRAIVERAATPAARTSRSTRSKVRSTMRWKRLAAPAFRSRAAIIGVIVRATMPEMHHRAGQRHGEFAEQRAGQPAGEAERREHRGQRHASWRPPAE